MSKECKDSGIILYYVLYCDKDHHQGWTFSSFFFKEEAEVFITDKVRTDPTFYFRVLKGIELKTDKIVAPKYVIHE